MTSVLQALSAPRRREILRLVWDRERPAGEICRELGDVTFGAVSQHLRVLREAALVRARGQGRSRLYSASKADLGPLAQWLEQTWKSGLYRLKIRAEMEEARRGPPGGRRRRSTNARRHSL